MLSFIYAGIKVNGILRSSDDWEGVDENSAADDSGGTRSGSPASEMDEDSSCATEGEGESSATAKPRKPKPKPAVVKESTRKKDHLNIVFIGHVGKCTSRGL